MIRNRLSKLGGLFGQVASPGITITILAEPALSINVDKTTGYVGDSFSFHGFYFDDYGNPLEGYLVVLYSGVGNYVGEYVTSGTGEWAVSWTAPSVGSFSFYAEVPYPTLPE